MLYLWSKRWSERRDILMSRRGDNIRKRADGRWEGRYRINTVNGEKMYKSIYGKSYGEVKEKLANKIGTARGSTLCGLKESDINTGITRNDIKFCTVC